MNASLKASATPGRSRGSRKPRVSSDEPLVRNASPNVATSTARNIERVPGEHEHDPHRREHEQGERRVQRHRPGRAARRSSRSAAGRRRPPAPTRYTTRVRRTTAPRGSTKVRIAASRTRKTSRSACREEQDVGQHVHRESFAPRTGWPRTFGRVRAEPDRSSAGRELGERSADARPAARGSGTCGRRSPCCSACTSRSASCSSR